MYASRPRLKILIVSDAWEPQINGVVRTYQHIITHLEAMGHEVQVIGPKRFVNTAMPGYGEIRLALMPYYRLKGFIKKFKPDAIHIAVEGPLGWAARRYCMMKNIPFTTSYHTHFPDYVAKRAPFAKDFARQKGIEHVRTFHAPAASIMVATESLENDLRGFGFQNEFRRLSRGVDASVFKPMEPTLFADLPKPVMLYVGRVAVEKNLEAFLSLDRSGTKVIVGAGPDLEMLRKKYPDAVFTGAKVGHELAAHYASADVFVFPSRTDTFGIVLIEALACGLPVAGYPVTGPVDIITEDFLGAVDEDLNAAVTRALAHGSREERARYAAKMYSWPSVAADFLYYLIEIDADLKKRFGEPDNDPLDFLEDVELVADGS